MSVAMLGFELAAMALIAAIDASDWLTPVASATSSRDSGPAAFRTQSKTLRRVGSARRWARCQRDGGRGGVDTGLIFLPS